MKTVWQAFGAVVIFLASLSCSEVKFQSKTKNTQASCVGEGCETPYTYSWFQGGYNGNCSVACGGGVETQVVNCQRSDGVTVTDAECSGSGTKPDSSRQCNIQACTQPYNWNIGNWTACSKSCGIGTQTRIVYCESNGTPVADGECTKTTAKPATSQNCNTHVCSSDSYSWQLDPGKCSKTCGGGLEKYICKRNDGTTVADSNCTDVKPQTACNTHACSVTYTYSWITGGWGSCSKTCGSGVRTRDVTCRRSDGSYVSDSYCAGQSQPASQEVCNTQSCPVVGRDVTTTKTVAAPAADVVLIIDDSSSMAADNLKLAQRMGGFLSDLDASNIDYRVCLTTTDVGYYKGSPITWGSYSGSNWVSAGVHVIQKSTANKSALFTDTIKYLGAEWSSDEQGIKAMGLMIRDFSGSGCFRTGASLSVILISDENERSVGGNQSWSSAQYKPLETDNYPDTLINRVKSTFGSSKPFIWNSIIVKPGDTACESSQDAQGTPSFFGTLYNELSTKTGGHVGSICASDYSSNLQYIKNGVVNSMPSVQLECVPMATPQVTISPAFSTNISVQGSQVKFNPALPAGRTVTVKYKCPN